MSRNRTARAATSHRMHASALLRNVLSQRSPDDWFTMSEAAVYLERARGTLRNLVSSGDLVPDGKGARRTSLFRRRTLDAFMVSGPRKGSER